MKRQKERAMHHEPATPNGRDRKGEAKRRENERESPSQKRGSLSERGDSRERGEQRASIGVIVQMRKTSKAGAATGYGGGKRRREARNDDRLMSLELLFERRPRGKQGIPRKSQREDKDIGRQRKESGLEEKKARRENEGQERDGQGSLPEEQDIFTRLPAAGEQKSLKCTRKVYNTFSTTDRKTNGKHEDRHMRWSGARSSHSEECAR